MSYDDNEVRFFGVNYSKQDLFFGVTIGLWIVMQFTFIVLKGNGAEGLSVWMAASPTFAACGFIALGGCYLVISPVIFSRLKAKKEKKIKKMECAHPRQSED